MKRLFLLAAVLFAFISMQAQLRIAVLNPTGNISPEKNIRIREEINLVLGGNRDYVLLAWEQIDRITDVIIKEQNAIFDESTLIRIGSALGVDELIITDVISENNFYYIYCKQVNARTAVIEKQGRGRIRCVEHIDLAAKEAASAFVTNPELSPKKIARMKKEAGCPDVGSGNVIPNPFRVKMLRSNYGLSVGYVQKSWKVKDEQMELSEKRGFCGDKAVPGFQVGFRFDRYLAPSIFGLGIHSGISFEYYNQKGKLMDETEEKLTFEEIAISIPLQGIYRFDFSRHIGCFINYGVSADIGIYSKVAVKSKESSEVIRNIYGNESLGNLKRFNCSLVYGAGVQIDRLMLSVSVSKGLFNQSDDSDTKVFQNKEIQANLTLMF